MPVNVYGNGQPYAANRNNPRIEHFAFETENSLDASTSLIVLARSRLF